MEETNIQPNNSPNSNKQEKPYNLDSNIAGMLCYLPYIGLFTSTAFAMIEKEDRFVKFHAIQGLLLAVAHIILYTGFTLTVFLIPLLPLLNIAAFGVWAFMMWKAYEKEKYELPFIGKIVKDQMAKNKQP